ncbi:MAG: hypothetical protein M1819_000087 [Sarea resinae]|nr:MAG: hypothetical protein M1819_000087 [Sarea resinae]
MANSATPPPIPVRSSVRLPAHRRRRSSLPPPSSNPNRRSSNYVQVQPASPEVISSLISSLSAISTPAKEHFDNLPNIGASRSTPSSPSAFHETFPHLNPDGHDAMPGSPTGGGFGMDYGAYNQPSHSHDFLHPDDAAVPPVIRTAKPPSGFSPLTASQAPGGDHSSSPIKNYFRPGSRGSGSKGSKDKDDVSSIGSLSIEPGLPRDSTASRDSGESASKKSNRSYKGLMYMSSKERLRGKENERKRASFGAYGSSEALGMERSGGIRLSMPPPSSSPMLAETAINEEPSTTPGQRNGSSPNGRTSNSSPSPPGIGGGKVIPTRDSSLRKTSNSKKRQSYRSSRHSPKPTPEEDADTDEKEERRLRGDEIVLKHGEALRDMKPPKKERPHPPKLPLTPFNSQSPLNGAPSYPPPPPLEPPVAASATASVQVAQSIQVEEKLAVEESAPSPSIVQRKVRDGGNRVSSLTGKPVSRAVSDASPVSPISRSNSRLKRLSNPSSPVSGGKHQRRFSFSRNTESPVPTAKSPLTVPEERPSSADSIDDAVDRYLSSPRLSHKIRHPQTGRVISFSEVGDSEGFAVFCCVGMGLTRYITAFYDELAATLKLRLITPDRPGVGESQPYSDGSGTPLAWPDDVYAICQALKITKFSILAHSAGAIYALATALRMPQHIRGRIHLLAPWIPPSQLSPIATHPDSPPAGTLPTTQRILRALPTTILKAANSSFMSATSSSVTSSLPKSPRRTKRKVGTTGRDTPGLGGRETPAPVLRPESVAMLNNPSGMNGDRPLTRAAADMAPADDPNSESNRILAAAAFSLAEKERQTIYDARLTHAIWDLATTNANPAVDLLVCLERRQTIGFRYVDITRSVVIHHGSKDTRVPVENVKWLGKTMRRCEVRILEGEGHGLMASAGVMGGVLMEVAKEWEDWMRVVNHRGNGRRATVGKGSEWGS